MRIAIAALKKQENSQISMQAGRAPYYLIFDKNFKLLESLSNPFKRGSGGAGFGVAKMLSDNFGLLELTPRLGSLALFFL